MGDARPLVENIDAEGRYNNAAKKEFGKPVHPSLLPLSFINFRN